MIHMKMRSLLLLILIVFGFSCGKDDGGTPDLPFLSAKADGTVKDCNVVSVTLVGGTLVINASTTAGDVAFVLNINNYTSGQIGTFNIGQGNFSSASYREGTTSYSAGTTAGSGRIQITNSNSTGIQGSFEFTGVSVSGASKTITEGRFSAYY
jgi:Family of unknown function (DUF6252)